MYPQRLEQSRSNHNAASPRIPSSRCRRSTGWRFALAALIAIISVSARATEPIVEEELGEKLDAYLTRLEAIGISGAYLFEKDGDIIGRPADVAQGPDGAIYISDDYAGAIYRVTYTGDPRNVPQSI